MSTITIEQILEELKTCEDELCTDASITDLSSMNEKAMRLTGYLARSGVLVAEANRHYNKAKKLAYERLEFRYASTGRDLKPMLAKDYISSSCYKEAFAADMADRLNRAITHTLETMRTTISAEKAILFNLKEQV